MHDITIRQPLHGYLHVDIDRVHLHPAPQHSCRLICNLYINPCPLLLFLSTSQPSTRLPSTLLTTHPHQLHYHVSTHWHHQILEQGTQVVITRCNCKEPETSRARRTNRPKPNSINVTYFIIQVTLFSQRRASQINNYLFITNKLSSRSHCITAR